MGNKRQEKAGGARYPRREAVSKTEKIQGMVGGPSSGIYVCHPNPAHSQAP